MPAQITMYWHCRKCLAERPEDHSPASFQAIEVGWTNRGIQVWCRRHDINIIHIDFEGKTLPADLGEAGDFGETLD